MVSDNGGPVSERPYRGLLVDYGGVVTSNLFDSFSSFCDLEGLEPEAIRSRMCCLVLIHQYCIVRSGNQHTRCATHSSSSLRRGAGNGASVWPTNARSE